ncbi:UNVERIFIED_CONTAM: hypothetical protein FKN15_075819 [Acipenser sinensis]
MTSVFEKLQNYIGLLALPSTKPEAILQANSSAVFTQLAACLHGLQGVMKVLYLTTVPDEECLEQLIKSHYMSRVVELTSQLQVADSSVVHFNAEDELTTTKRSYEDQLSMMSDHLCSMNETLTKQREEIDTLKMGSKGNSKKSKSR